jgi:hypothetical protein
MTDLRPATAEVKGRRHQPFNDADVKQELGTLVANPTGMSKVAGTLRKWIQGL